SLPQGQSNADYLSSDHTAARISLSLKSASSKEIMALEDMIQTVRPTKDSGLKITTTGESLPVAHLTSTNVQSMLLGLLGSIVGIALTFYLFSNAQGLGWALGGAVAIPLLAGFGIWAWLFEEIGIATVAIVSLTMGIIVDDTAHLISECHAKSAKSPLGGAMKAVIDALRETTPGIVATTIVLSVALGLLSFSSFAVNQTLGVVSAIIIMLALVFTLFVLPRLTLNTLASGKSLAPKLTVSNCKP
ncbi:MAG: MMPL family transporter, partial [Pseudomonadales bacterium]